MTTRKIPIARPLFDRADEEAVLETLRSGWVGPGPQVAAFEQRFSQYVGAPYASAVSSCTAALHLAALAAGFGPGDEVLVPAFTWISTPNAIELAGARAVFCDIDPMTFNIDAADAARRVTSRTRGIIPVHLFGLAADMRGVADLAARHGLVVIEDAACALGTRVEGRHVGLLGDVGCFSFHPRKSITTGEGGMLVTARADLHDKLRSLRDIGADRTHFPPELAAQQLMPDHPLLGFNYRLTDLQAALGVTQLAKFDGILGQRLALARRYGELITGSALAQWLRPPALPLHDEHSFQAYVCRLLPPDGSAPTAARWHERRNQLMKALFEAGIATRPGTHAPHMLSYYSTRYGLRPEDFPQARDADRLTIALPLYAGLGADEQQWICDRLAQLWEELQP